MELKRHIAAILLGNKDKPITVKAIARLTGKPSNEVSSILSRDFRRAGYLWKLGRGEYKVIDPEGLQDLLNKKATKQQKDIMGDISPLFVRLHHVHAKIPSATTADKLKDWRTWELNNSSVYETIISTGKGFTFTVRHNSSKKKGTLTLMLHEIMANASKLELLSKRINTAFQQALIQLNQDYGFTFSGLLDYHVKEHYAIALKIYNGYELPKTFDLNAFYNVDRSKGYPEMETQEITQIKKLVDTGQRQDRLDLEIRKELIAMKETQLELIKGITDLTNAIKGPKGPQHIRQMDTWDQGAYR